MQVPSLDDSMPTCIGSTCPATASPFPLVLNAGIHQQQQAPQGPTGHTSLGSFRLGCEYMQMGNASGRSRTGMQLKDKLDKLNTCHNKSCNLVAVSTSVSLVSCIEQQQLCHHWTCCHFTLKSTVLPRPLPPPPLCIPPCTLQPYHALTDLTGRSPEYLNAARHTKHIGPILHCMPALVSHQACVAAMCTAAPLQANISCKHIVLGSLHCHHLISVPLRGNSISGFSWSFQLGFQLI